MIQVPVVGAAAFFFVRSFLEWRDQENQRMKLDRVLEIRRPDSFYQRLRRLLSRRRERRVWRRHLPDFLEFLALTLSAGLPFQSAFQKAVTFTPPSSLRHELEMTVSEMEVGKSRGECLMELGQRLGDRSLQRIFRLLAHTLKQGGAMENILREQAAALRSEHYLSLEKQAQTIPLRLLLPIFLFLLPAVMLILMGPLMIQVVQRGSLF